MTRYYVEDGQVFVGTDRQIRSLYKRLAEHGFIPVFSDSPAFRQYSMYGIVINEDSTYSVINADTIVRMLLV